MDVVLEFVDTFIADYAYAYVFPIGHPNKTDVNASTQKTEPCESTTEYFYVQPSQAAYLSTFARDNLYRQFLTLYISSWVFGTAVYFAYSTILYHLVFDKRLLNHPKFMKNQIWNEIKMSLQSFPFVAIFIATLFQLEIRGYSKLYSAAADGSGWWYDVLQIPLFFLFSECFAYWNHRFSHHPRVYGHFLYMHKLHHRFIVPTPFSALAAHPIDAISVPFPCMIFPFIFPLQKMIHIGLIVVLNFWNIVIHDGEFRMNNRFLVSSASHSLHHVQRKCNFGFYLTIFDRLHGTYRKPENWMFQEKRRINEIERKNENQAVKEIIIKTDEVLKMNRKSEKCE